MSPAFGRESAAHSLDWVFGRSPRVVSLLAVIGSFALHLTWIDL
jgi:hypothetical protein